MFVIYYAGAVETEHDRTEWETLNALDDFHVTAMNRQGIASARVHNDLDGLGRSLWGRNHWSQIFRMGCKCRFGNLCECRLLEDSDLIIQNPSRPLLYYALEREWYQSTETRRIKHQSRPALNPKMVQLLLSHGADTNEKVSGPSEEVTAVWFSFIKHLVEELFLMPEDFRELILQAVVSLVKAGADCDFICDYPNLKSVNRK